MSATREQMKTEAISRMNALHMSKEAIKAFDEGKVWFSESFGALYDSANEKELIDAIKSLEKNGDKIVYHAIHSFAEFGELWSLLFVGNDKNEWKYEHEDMRDGIVFSYVHNCDDEWCSEFGDIGVKPIFGGLKRIY